MILPRYDLPDFLIQLHDIHFLPRVFCLYIGRDRENVLIIHNVLILCELRKMRDFFMLCKDIHDTRDILRGELVVIRHLHALGRSVDEECAGIRFILLHHHDAGRDRSAEEQIARELDDAVDEVVIHKILADFLLRAAAVHDAGEADDGRGAIRSEPGKTVHDEGHIRLALWRKDSGRGKARVIDEERIAIPCPLDRVWWIRYDEFEGFIIPMLRTDQRIFTGDVEFIEADIMQEHIDAAEIVRRDIDFLPVEAIADRISPQHLFGFQKERSTPTCRISKVSVFDTIER